MIPPPLPTVVPPLPPPPPVPSIKLQTQAWQAKVDAIHLNRISSKHVCIKKV